jgi:hypothetical protein
VDVAEAHPERAPAAAVHLALPLVDLRLSVHLEPPPVDLRLVAPRVDAAAVHLERARVGAVVAREL